MAALALISSFASLLGAFDAGDLNRVTITDGCETTGRSWIVSATNARGEGATCIGDGTGAPTCVMYAGKTPAHVKEVMCERRDTARAVAAPTWAQPVLAALRAVPADARVEITPVANAVRPALGLVVDEQLFVAIRTPDGWRRSAEPVEQLQRLEVHSVIDTTSLTGTPSYGAITSSYSGGSESGTETTGLTVLRPGASDLEPAGMIALGQFTWLLDATQRRKYPKAAGSLDARPHVEVQLTPRIVGDVLVLELKRATIAKELRGTCKRSPEGDDLNAPCILVDMRARAGRYRLVGSDFERVR